MFDEYDALTAIPILLICVCWVYLVSLVTHSFISMFFLCSPLLGVVCLPLCVRKSSHYLWAIGIILAITACGMRFLR